MLQRRRCEELLERHARSGLEAHPLAAQRLARGLQPLPLRDDGREEPRSRREELRDARRGQPGAVAEVDVQHAPLRATLGALQHPGFERHRERRENAEGLRALGAITVEGREGDAAAFTLGVEHDGLRELGALLL